MNISIPSHALHGSIVAPPSKSAMQRAIATSFIRKGTAIIYMTGMSNDDKIALHIIEKLGAKIISYSDKICIESNGIPDQLEQPLSIHCGESGLSTRMFTPIIALCKTPITITGEGSLINRPMQFFHDIAPLLGFSIQSNQGKLPMTIQGPLKTKDIQIDGSLSSQFLTGLLMAYSVSHTCSTTIQVSNLTSKPYIDLTIHILEKFGLPVPTHERYERFVFSDDRMDDTNHSPISYTVEGDWSGGAFLLVAGALHGNMIIKNLSLQSTQADKAIIKAIEQTGAFFETNVNDSIIFLSDQPPLQPFDFDATDCPDLFPPLVALAAYCKGISIIHGTNRLIHKESNRAIALKKEFKKMNIDIVLQGNDMLITGGNIKNTVVHSHHDHRIAMACAIAATKGEGVLTIEDAEAINKSYPTFYTHILDILMK